MIPFFLVSALYFFKFFRGIFKELRENGNVGNVGILFHLSVEFKKQTRKKTMKNFFENGNNNGKGDQNCWPSGNHTCVYE